jgi:hypothetical protein
MNGRSVVPNSQVGTSSAVVNFPFKPQLQVVVLKEEFLV